jgi:hypothetical protein
VFVIAIAAVVAPLAGVPERAGAQRGRVRADSVSAEFHSAGSIPTLVEPAVLEIDRLPSDHAGPVSPFHRLLAVRALQDVELVADRRLLWLEVQAVFDPGQRRPRGRRPLRCEHPDRPRRVDSTRLVHLAAGEVWSEWIDLREYCWGRAQAALGTPDASVRASYGLRAARRDRFVVRAGSGIGRTELGPVPVPFDPVSRELETDPDSPVRVELADADAPSGSALVLRVSVRGRAGRRRAYVRPDRLQFRVRGPEGPYVCALPKGGGAVTPDLFEWLTARTGPRLALEGAWVCRGRFQRAGVYEVEPVLELDHDGAEWELGAITGTFVGAPALVRIWRDERGYVARTVGQRRDS